eukprot:TRINITY_DN10565_c0_g1_i1.p1 TRINITY_DN10565_c0_g1~~TRINITY_DN10565_c0_g1_i1.p1  ORF type:complete len:475 (+),score=139.75 TRINITY_DN10565_c0_g1_i1:40-1464(+)
MSESDDVDEYDNCQFCGKDEYAKGKGDLLLCDNDGCFKTAHMRCLRPKLTKVPKGEWFCPDCLADDEDDEEYNDEPCYACGKSDNPSALVICDCKENDCQRTCHYYCDTPRMGKVPLGEWLCDKCRAKAKPESTPDKFEKLKKNRKITEFFSPLKKLTIDIKEGKDTPPKKGGKVLKDLKGISKTVAAYLPRSSATLSKTKQQKAKTGTKKSPLFVLAPTGNKEDSLERMKSLIFALESKGYKFANSLQYEHIEEKVTEEGKIIDGIKLTNEDKEHINNAALDVSNHNKKLIPSLKSDDLEVFECMRAQWKSGICPAVKVDTNPELKMFIVRADADLPKHSLICEYCGTVARLSSRGDSDNDSIMDLIQMSKDDTDYDKVISIFPEKKCNIARFLSGINNGSKESKKKENVETLRVVLQHTKPIPESRRTGRAKTEKTYSMHVVMRTKKAVKKGTELFYNYNGYNDNYDTQGFV